MPLPMVKFFDSLPLLWKLATVRLCLYLYIVGDGAWKSCVEGFDSVGDMTPLQIQKMHHTILASLVTTVIAFLDNGMSSVKQRDTLSADDMRTILQETSSSSQTVIQTKTEELK